MVELIVESEIVDRNEIMFIINYRNLLHYSVLRLMVILESETE